METPLPATDLSRPTVTMSRLPDADAEAAGPTVGWTLAGPATDPEAGGDAGAQSTNPTLCFGEYLVVAELGEGGMGRVYKAIDRTLGRHVAVKVLRSADPFEASRFRGEAEMIALLSHPNIVQIFAIDNAPDGRPYIALEFAEGGSLDRELKGQPIEPRRAAEMAEVLARAVHYAHEKGVIHRDLKPHNILRGKGGVLKLTDFGLAKQFEVTSGMTPSGAVMGTPSYMAPEQAEGKVKQLGPAVDVYGLGAILYEMLTGRPPFRGANLVETLELVRWAEPPSPTQLVPRLHRDLATICLKCLRKPPGQRYATAGDLADDLRHWLNGETIVARSAASWEKVWRQVRRRPWQAATAAVTVLAATALAVGGLYYYDRERQAAHDRQIAENKAAEQERLDALRREGMEKLRTRSQASLGALDNIREMMLRGDLRNVPGLDPLRNNLFAYYHKLNDQLRSEEGYDKGELARSWIEVGNLIHETGLKENAWQAYQEANRLLTSLDQDTPEARVRRAEAEGLCGRLAFELNHLDQSRASCGVIEGLLRDAPDSDRRAAGVLAEMWHLRGDLCNRDRDKTDALRTASDCYDRAIAFRTRALGGDADLSVEGFVAMARRDRERFEMVVENLQGLARDHAHQASVSLDRNDLGRADTSYWKAHRMREHVRDVLKTVSDTLPRYRLDSAIAESEYSQGPLNCAAVQRYSRALATAKHFAEESLKLRTKVSEQNPNNIQFRYDVCIAAALVAELKLTLGEYDRELEALIDAAGRVPRDSATKEGYSIEALATLATSHLLRAQYLAYRPAAVELAKNEPAKTERKSAAARLNELLEKSPSDPVATFNLAVTHAMMAEGMSLTGEDADKLRERFHSDAIRAVAKAIQLGYRDRHPDDIREMRAFAKIKGNPKFEEALNKLRVARDQTSQAATKTPASSP